MTNFGVLTHKDGQQMICQYDNATNMVTFASEHLKSVMEEEGYQLDDMKGYLEGWMECINEIREDNDDVLITNTDEVLEEAADNLTYCNVHLIVNIEGRGWESLNSENKRKFFDAMVEVLKRGHFLGNEEQEKFLSEIKGTQFEKDLLKSLDGVGTRGQYNLIVSIRDCKLWLMGMKPHRNWNISQVKTYFGIKGNKEKLVEILEGYRDILLEK